MRSSRGMGAVNPAKLPKTLRRKDGDKFSVYAEGGKVNEAGNYTEQFVAQPKAIAKKTARFR